jgi:hypothetical protein
MNMSFVVAVPDLVQTAAQDLAGICSTLEHVSEAIAAPTTGLAPAAEDQVSAAVASLFRNFGEEYQALESHAAAFHGQFLQTLTAGASAYASTEANAVRAMAAATPALGLNLGSGLGGVGLSGGLGGLEASLSGGLPGLLGISVNVGVSNGLGGGLSGLVQTSESLIANLGTGLPGLTLPGWLGLSLPNLGANLGAVTNAELSLPRLALDVFAGLRGLSLPGLPGLSLPGLLRLSSPNLGADLGAVINAELALPRLALDVFAGLPGLSLNLPGVTLPGVTLTLPGLTLPRENLSLGLLA